MASFAFVTIGDRYNAVEIPAVETILASEEITASGVNQQTAAAPNLATHVRVGADVAIYISWGTNPDATSDDRLWLPANSVEYFAIDTGYKVAVVTA